MRSKSFLYIVEVGGVTKLIRHTSPGRAVKSACGPVEVHRATAEGVAMLLGAGVELIDGTKEK